MTILPDDIKVVLIDFPKKKVRENVVENADGSYTIFIDARLSTDQQREKFEHGLKHIEDGDFEKADVQLIEAAAHGMEVPKEKVKEWVTSRGVKAAMTRAKKRAEQAAELLNMDYEDYLFARHDYELFKGE